VKPRAVVDRVEFAFRFIGLSPVGLIGEDL
jgi:hypothetical protein